MSYRRHRLSLRLKDRGGRRTYTYCERCGKKVVGRFDKRGRCNP